VAILDLDAAASPFALPEVWDAVTVAGKVWTGKVEIKGAKRAYKWDIKDGMGLQGALETYRGQTPTPFTITFYIWTDAMYAAWLDFVKLFQYNGVKFQPKPVSIYHPQLDTLGIGQILCEDIGAVEKVSDDLMFSVTVSLREFFRPLPVSPVTPDAASNGDPNDDRTDPRVKKLQAANGAKQQSLDNLRKGRNPQVLP
jgi:hypothetical protein